MLKVEPFMAVIDVAPFRATNPIFREVQVVGIADRPEGPRWVAIENHDGWEFPKFVECVKWSDPSTAQYMEKRP